MSVLSACPDMIRPDAICIPLSPVAMCCPRSSPAAVTNLSQPYWNPNSERYETLQQSLQHGRRERALAFSTFLSRWFRLPRTE